MTQQTLLHDVHVAAGGHMVDFAGWRMPLHYGSQIKEHLAVRENVGVFDVSHMLAVDVHGSEAASDLRHLLANDVHRLKPNGALYSCMLNERGGVQDDMLAYEFSPTHFRLVLNAARRDADLAWIKDHLLPGRGTTLNARMDGAILALQGPKALACLVAVLGDEAAFSQLPPFHFLHREDWLVARTGYTGEDGFEIMLPGKTSPQLWERLVQRGAVPAGLGARDILRLEAGLMLYGTDLDEEHTPFECGLRWTVAMDASRDFIGHKALLDSAPRSKMVGLVNEEAGMLRPEHLLVTPHGEGKITSSTFSPALNRSVALARVPMAVEYQSRAHVRHPQFEKNSTVRVVKPPFIRHGKILV